MARQASCCLPHFGLNGPPILGISPLSPSPTPRPLLQLLGCDDLGLQEQMAKGHAYAFQYGQRYAFNMGSGKIITLPNYKVAMKALMERNMPEVLDDKQTQVVFVPDTHLPSNPRIVDFEEYKKRVGEKTYKGAEGYLAEMQLSEELHKFYVKALNKNVVVYEGPKLKVPGKSKGSNEQEFDFVIVNKREKAVIDIESKITLDEAQGKKAVEQTRGLKRILEEFFPDVFKSNDWRFVSMVYCSNKQFVCTECSPFVIYGPQEVATKLRNLYKLLATIGSQKSSHPEYLSLVQGFAFAVLSQPTSTYCTIATAVFDKVVGVPARGKAKEKAGQGDFKSIIFWNDPQANVMQKQFVFFASPCTAVTSKSSFAT